ncbi:cyclic AMP-responsive element-binding protein 5 isoform X5 [Prionailurus iriomotensis]
MIYEESKMNLEQERPFVCSAPGCSQCKERAEMANSCPLCHQTPTPTRFLKNCEEVGLFNELDCSLEHEFRKAQEEESSKRKTGENISMHNTVGGAMAGPGAHQLGSTRMPNHDTSVVIQQAMPSPQSSSVITQAPSTNRQIGACPRLSIFSATSPQQTETAHASLHAWDPAQPNNAGIFCRLDANKNATTHTDGETNVSELQPPGNARSKSQQPLCFSPSPANAFRSQNEVEGRVDSPPRCHVKWEYEHHGTHDGNDGLPAGPDATPSHALAPTSAPDAASPSPLPAPAPAPSPPSSPSTPSPAEPPTSSLPPSRTPCTSPDLATPTPALRQPSTAVSPATQQMQPTQTIQPPQPTGGRRRRVVDEDPDERRRKFLERNRAAATRCRQKRKVWVMSLEKKAEELTQTNMQLQITEEKCGRIYYQLELDSIFYEQLNEVSMLKNEVAQLKQLLLTHKDCPITAMQKESQGYLSPESSPPASPVPACSQHQVIQHNTVTTSSAVSEVVGSSTLSQLTTHRTDLNPIL